MNITISVETYQHLISCLQAHAPADAGAREVLEELQREVQLELEPKIRFPLGRWL